MVFDLARLRPFAFGSLGLSALGVWYGTGLHPMWWVTWLAPVPVLHFAYRAGTGPACAATFGAWFLGSLNLCAYFRSVLAIPFLPVALFLIIPAMAFVLAVLLSRALVRRGSLTGAALAVPATWVSFEYVVSVFGLNGTAGNLAYTQVDCPTLLQLASLTGLWGISFVVLLVPTSLAVALSAPRAKAPLVRVLAFVLAVLAGVACYGTWRLHRPRDAGDTVTVGLVATDVPARIFPRTREDALETLRLYVEQVDPLARRGAEVIVLPEKLLSVTETGYAKVTELFQDAAIRNHVRVIVGLARDGDPLDHNVALVFSPNGSVEAVYEKHHLVPQFEDRFHAGADRTVLRRETVPWGVQICKDMDFPPLSRDYAAEGVGLMLVPAWDFDQDRWLHGRMAVVRGVEGGFCVARAAKQGLLTVSDECGRILAEERSDSAPFATLTARVAVTHRATIYSRCGDWLAWISLTVAALALASLIRRPRQPA
ncbi:apolipoprotein N-acyltransferase [Frigoriglobus tundricola]|uniref:CN hydrolase domain-containing protein n=1 Tax=Frigoriglobus tundricola TaxID=2774151 RepID=A0A6M5YIQ2_9BACT|nr:apolipoprotein N-acyltransferase [Frigoriglobus tundricola]QJW92852.1 hypothetical protein FTUN_0349 [Frigoriglobus tundricola]